MTARPAPAVTHEQAVSSRGGTGEAAAAAIAARNPPHRQAGATRTALHTPTYLRRCADVAATAGVAAARVGRATIWVQMCPDVSGYCWSEFVM
jgi:hypothetical protein